MMGYTDRTKDVLKGLSQLLGWTYTLSWSASFYPQPLLNWQRKSTRGTSIDFPFLNVIGFSCYTFTTSMFLFSSNVRSQYAVRHPTSPEPTVRYNDLAFGIHALFWVYIVYSQYFPFLWGFDVPDGQRVSRTIKIIVWSCVLLLAATLLTMFAHNGMSHQDANTWAWIDVVYTVGNVKLIVTFFKYMPQAIMNYQRKSTEGWSIGTILFDVVGSVLSLAQLVIDASLQNDWSGIAGNPIKLGLSIISIGYDMTFIIQHYVLYRHSRLNVVEQDSRSESEHAPLLK